MPSAVCPDVLLCIFVCNTTSKNEINVNWIEVFSSKVLWNQCGHAGSSYMHMQINWYLIPMSFDIFLQLKARIVTLQLYLAYDNAIQYNTTVADPGAHRARPLYLFIFTDFRKISVICRARCWSTLPPCLMPPLQKPWIRPCFYV